MPLPPSAVGFLRDQSERQAIDEWRRFLQRIPLQTRLQERTLPESSQQHQRGHFQFSPSSVHRVRRQRRFRLFHVWLRLGVGRETRTQEIRASDLRAGLSIRFSLLLPLGPWS